MDSDNDGRRDVIRRDRGSSQSSSGTRRRSTSWEGSIHIGERHRVMVHREDEVGEGAGGSLVVTRQNRKRISTEMSRNSRSRERCSITGRKAVDCLLNGIEDRAVRVGAQAAQFREPEEVLKYLKTVKVGTTKDGEKLKQDRRNFGAKAGNNSNRFTSNNSVKPEQANRVPKCYNCDTEGHKSFECQKTAHKCTICSRLGHLESYCRNKKPDSQPKPIKNNSTAREEKQIAKLISSDKENDKFLMNVKVNGVDLEGFVDFGSQCTILTKQMSSKLNLSLQHDDLPMLKGINGPSFKPIGKCDAEIMIQGIKKMIEVFVVDDDVALKQPILVGQSFTERPDIHATKTSEEVVFEHAPKDKIFLRSKEDINIAPKDMKVIPVTSVTKYTGKIFVNGNVRGLAGQEYYLLPGEYALEAGQGSVLVQNISDKEIVFAKESLITRSIPVQHKYDVCTMSFAEDSLEDKVQCGTQVTKEQKLMLQKLLTKYGDCFSTGLKDLGFTNAGEMVIELKDSDPQTKDKDRFDAKRKTSHVYREGDLVSVKRDVPSDGKSMKLAAKFQGPYRIKKVLPNERFVVEDTPLTKKKGHRGYDNVVAIDKLKPWLNFDKNYGSSSDSEVDSEPDNRDQM
ncbi:hypothetical protein NE865_09504 [Phthorimaea operculella]|nr:hypothetical protein NE865_09504 [Phthorimaea operculella]